MVWYFYIAEDSRDGIATYFSVFSPHTIKEQEVEIKLYAKPYSQYKLKVDIAKTSELP